MDNSTPSLNTSRVIEPASQYIKLREEFVQNLNGTSMEEILTIAPLSALFLFISVSIKFWIFNNLNLALNPIEGNRFLPRIITFALDFVTLVLPIVFQLTIFADIAVVVLVCMMILSIFIIISAVSSVNIDIFYWRIPQLKNEFFHTSIITEKQTCITYFRSFVFLMTSVSILAVDFHVYPRRFAKTENYGVSLMDMGVGFYIMANAIVTKGNVPTRKLKDTVFESLMLLCFGVIRCALMQQIDYQLHITEYGAHWNFFITLGLVKLFSSVLLKVSGGRSLACGVALLLLHQCLLSFSLEHFVMSDLQRDNWVVANREGLVSLPGYLSLFLIGVSIKKLIFTVDRQTKQSTFKTKLNSILLMTTLCVILICSLNWLVPICRVSRRLANLPYVLWTTLVCFEYFIMGLVYELVSICFLPINLNNRCNTYSFLIPELFRNINKNAFLFFLISNFLTGFVNLSFDVLRLEASSSLILLLTYMVMNCAIVYVLYVCNIQVKI